MSKEYYEDEINDSVEESAEKMVEDDEISPEEEGFLKGYNEAAEYSEDEEDIDKEFE